MTGALSHVLSFIDRLPKNAWPYMQPMKIIWENEPANREKRTWYLSEPTFLISITTPQILAKNKLRTDKLVVTNQYVPLNDSFLVTVGIQNKQENLSIILAKGEPQPLGVSYRKSEWFPWHTLPQKYQRQLYQWLQSFDEKVAHYRLEEYLKVTLKRSIKQFLQDATRYLNNLPF